VKVLGSVICGTAEKTLLKEGPESTLGPKALAFCADVQQAIGSR